MSTATAASPAQPAAIPAEERLIAALDGMTEMEALAYVRRLSPTVRVFKVGLELFLSAGMGVVDRIGQSGAKVMLDLKLLDIPDQVTRALKEVFRHGDAIELATIHGFNRAMPELAQAPGREKVKLLVITALTSMDTSDLRALGIGMSTDEYIVALARRGREAGCDGAVCSGHEAALVKGAMGPDFLAVTPGIRPDWQQVAGDDQKRVMTPAQAIAGGADYIVVGRPLRKAPDPLEAATRMQAEIAQALAGRA